MVHGTRTLRYSLLKSGLVRGRVPAVAIEHGKFHVSRTDAAVGSIRVEGKENTLFENAMRRMGVARIDKEDDNA